jgi:hypothetical protein
LSPLTISSGKPQATLLIGAWRPHTPAQKKRRRGSGARQGMCRAPINSWCLPAPAPAPLAPRAGAAGRPPPLPAARRHSSSRRRRPPPPPAAAKRATRRQCAGHTQPAGASRQRRRRRPAPPAARRRPPPARRRRRQKPSSRARRRLLPPPPAAEKVAMRLQWVAGGKTSASGAGCKPRRAQCRCKSTFRAWRKDMHVVAMACRERLGTNGAPPCGGCNFATSAHAGI